MKRTIEEWTAGDPEAIIAFRGSFEFLSNFFIMPNGTTVEHGFQADKCALPEERAAILALPAHRAGAANRAGRRVVLVPGWDEMRLDVMLKHLRAKFAFPELSRKLLATGDHILVEGNDWKDDFWGVPFGKRGENHLGLLLMQVRREILEHPACCRNLINTHICEWCSGDTRKRLGPCPAFFPSPEPAVLDYERFLSR